MAAKLGLVLDCADAERLAKIWSAVIGCTILGGAGCYVVLVDDAGQGDKSSQFHQAEGHLLSPAVVGEQSGKLGSTLRVGLVAGLVEALVGRNADVAQ